MKEVEVLKEEVVKLRASLEELRKGGEDEGSEKRNDMSSGNSASDARSQEHCRDHGAR